MHRGQPRISKTLGACCETVLRFDAIGKPIRIQDDGQCAADRGLTKVDGDSCPTCGSGRSDVWDGTLRLGGGRRPGTAGRVSTRRVGLAVSGAGDG